MKFLNILLLSCFGFILNSCNENIVEDTFDQSQSNVNSIRFTAPDFKESSVNSRTSIDVAENGVKFSWSANDTIGIFPDEGAQVYFPMESGAGTNTASFTGGGWALKSSSGYAAYYPLRGEFYLDKKNIPLFYDGQVQTGNGTTDHLGAFDYMGANATVPEDGNVNFEFKHLGALVQLNIPMEEACNLNHIVLQTEEGEFVTKASLDLSSTLLKVTPIEKSKQYGIALNKLMLSGDNMTATVYFMLSPVDLSGKKISVIVRSDSKSYQYEFSGKNFQEGFAYSIDANSSASASDDDAMILVTRANFTNNFTAYLPQIAGSNITVDWGDGKKENHDYGGAFTHQYSVSEPTNFEIKISGEIWSLYSGSLEVYTITGIKQWGTLKLRNMGYAFNLQPLNFVADDKYGALQEVTNFERAFSGCNALTTIPEGLFDNCTKVTNFEGVFYNCSFTTIPEGLFKDCTNVTSFEDAFSSCKALTTIPEGLFENCTNVTSFDFAFSSCKALTIVPEGLFDNCTNVTSFEYTFANCNALTTIPRGLFDDCTKVTSFSSLFSQCYALTTIPEGIFDNCINVTDFSWTFNDCNSLRSVPTNLFDQNRKVQNFIRTFSGCHLLSGESPYTVINGVKYHLYERDQQPDYFVAPTSYGSCFNNTSLTDDIPFFWK